MNSDRGLSYADTVPEGSTVSSGAWWDKDYAGPPLVSFEGEIAKKLGIGLGDSVTVNVLGRNIDAKVASLRDVKWESIALNFIMVFSPNTLRAAPHNLLATVRLPPGGQPGRSQTWCGISGRPIRASARSGFATQSTSSARFLRRSWSPCRWRAASRLTAGALVLAGALATAQRRRILEAVILKTIGARRRQILEVHAWEYAVLAAIAALVAIALGSAVAWVAVTRVMELDYVFSLSSIAVQPWAGGGNDCPIRRDWHLGYPAGAPGALPALGIKD